jgi:hypothetical protein
MLPRLGWLLSLVGVATVLVLAGLYWQRWQGAAVPHPPTPRQVQDKHQDTTARGGTPMPTRATADSATSGSPRVGQATVLYAASGAPIAAIAVRGVTDPLPAGPGTPTAGQRLVGVAVAIVNLGSAPLPVPLAAFGLRDHAGAVHAPLKGGDAVAASAAAAPTSAAPRRSTRPRGQSSRRSAATPGSGSAATPGPPRMSGSAMITVDPGATQELALRFLLPATTAMDTLLVQPGRDDAVAVAQAHLSPPAAPAAPTARRTPSSQSPTGGKNASRRAATPVAASQGHKGHGSGQAQESRPARGGQGKAAKGSNGKHSLPP